MSNVPASLSEETYAILKEAEKVFGLTENGQALSLAAAFLKVATQAKKEGKDLAVVQDIRTGNQFAVFVEEIIDLKTGVKPVNDGITLRTLYLK